MTGRPGLSWRIMLLLGWTLLAISPGHSETLDCLIEPYVVVNIGSPVDGLLATVPVDRGDRVQQGQVLASLK